MFRRFKESFRKLSLVKKFSVSATLLVFLIMVAVSILIVDFQKRAIREEMEKNQILLVQGLARDSVDALVFMDPLRLDELVRNILRSSGCVYAGVLDRKERVVGHTDRKLLGQNMPGIAGVPTGTSQEPRGISGDSSSVREIVFPVTAGREIIGTAFAGFSVNSVENSIENGLTGLKRYLFGASVLLFAVGIAGSFALARFLTTPMNRLMHSMEQVRTGNLDAEVQNEHLMHCWDAFMCEKAECPAFGKGKCWTMPDTSCCRVTSCAPQEKIQHCRKCIIYRESCGDEVGELIDGFNEMVIKLQQSIADLEKAAEERLRLERLSALGEMALTVAHEIKNPLNAIHGAISYLQRNFEGEILREFLSIIEEETRRLNGIVTSFLRFSRPAPLNLRECSIEPVVRETVELVRQEATERNIEVVIAIRDILEPFYFDSAQCKQALLNILVNALDATGEGGTVKITVTKEEPGVKISIRDSGQGIPEDLIAEIFKPFFTTKTRGTGLGLACVERIVRDHKGFVSVKSETGRGTEVSVVLPTDMK